MTELAPGQARMTHPDPDLDDEVVSASQVPHLEHIGWRYVEGDREDWPEDLQRAGREGMVYVRHPETGGTAFVPELSAPLRERGWEVADPDAEQAEALDAKTVADLRELAKERGISPIPTTKAELIEALEQRDSTEPTKAGDEPAQDTEEE